MNRWSMLRNKDKIRLLNRHSDKGLRRGGKTTRVASRRKSSIRWLRYSHSARFLKKKTWIPQRQLNSMIRRHPSVHQRPIVRSKQANTPGPLPKMLPRRMMLLLFNGHASSSASSRRVCDASLSAERFFLMFIWEREWARKREVSTCTV